MPGGSLMAFKTRRHLRDEVTRLEYRVKELEEKICPCEDHDWKVVGSYLRIDWPDNFITVEHLKCRKCGKTNSREDWN
jgi:hypothetical protein